MSLKRIAKELQSFNDDPQEECSVEPVEGDMYSWRACILGPKGTPFENGKFRLSIRFPEDYPFRAPKVVFTTKIYHSDIDSRGSICFHMLDRDFWKPHRTIKEVLRSILALLTDPNVDEPLVTDIARVYRTDRTKYNETAKEWTLKFASE